MYIRVSHTENKTYTVLRHSSSQISLFTAVHATHFTGLLERARP